MTPALQYLIFCAGIGTYNFKRPWFIKQVVRSLPVNGIRDNECALVWAHTPHTQAGWRKQANSWWSLSVLHLPQPMSTPRGNHAICSILPFLRPQGGRGLIWLSQEAPPQQNHRVLIAEASPNTSLYYFSQGFATRPWTRTTWGYRQANLYISCAECDTWQD